MLPFHSLNYSELMKMFSHCKQSYDAYCNNVFNPFEDPEEWDVGCNLDDRVEIMAKQRILNCDYLDVPDLVTYVTSFDRSCHIDILFLKLRSIPRNLEEFM